MQALLLLLAAALPAACDRSAAPPPPPPADSALDSPLPELRPGDAERARALLARAQEELAGHRTVQAIDLLQQAVAADPPCLAARLGLGWLLLAPGRSQNQGQALLQFRLARSLDPDGADGVAGEGVARAALGDPERARPLLERARMELATDSPRRWQVELALGTVAVAEGDPERARQADEAALQALPADALVPDRLLVLCALGQLLLESGDLTGAREYLSRAIAQDRADLAAHFLWSRLMQQTGDTAEAERFRQIHDHLRQLLDQSSRYYQSDHATRVRLRRELLTLYPENTRGRLDLIRELLDVGDFAAAVQEIQVQVQQAGGADAELLFLLASARAGLGDLAGARQIHDQMRTLDPSIPWSVTRSILERWRKAEGVDAARFEEEYRAWSGGR